MKIQIVYLGIGLFCFTPAYGDQSGVEVRQYLTGTIPELTQSFMTSYGETVLNVGVNIAYHGNQGVQASESGLGYGGGLGYRNFFLGNYFYGIRLDVFRMEIDWQNTTSQTGTSHFVLFQPTAEVGRRFEVGNWRLAIALSGGSEFNTFDDGAPTGQGAIILLGVSITLPTP